MTRTLLMGETIKVALAGNPNCGKTTLFNNLTGMHQHVGNWPGKTVERKEGYFELEGKRIELIDLPGTYSLTAYSSEEIVAREYISDENPNIVLNVVDASNLERNLYLSLQLIELGANVVIALNMNKSASKKGLKIDRHRLSLLLGVPVITIEAVNNTGKPELLNAIIRFSFHKTKNKIRYGHEIDGHLDELESLIGTSTSSDSKMSSKWIALKLLEEDEEIVRKIKLQKNSSVILNSAKRIRKHLRDVFGDEPSSLITDARYGFISGLLAEVCKKPLIDKPSASDKIDKIITHRILGIPIFLLVMYLSFHFIFALANPLVSVIQYLFGLLSGLMSGLVVSVGAPGWAASFLSDGVIGGVGSVIVFLPNILLLFLVISFLEDTGYMARVAFIMDKLMHKIGLHGKSFIPLILGFGCNVPAVMATRTLESRKDRILTMLITPFMSCSARLPVYILFVSAFFSDNQGLAIFSIYILGILVAVIMGLFFKKTFFSGLSSPFIMELPPYRLPTIRGSLIHMWERGKLFLAKAGTIILAAVIVIWFLGSVPFGVEYGSKGSLIGLIGTFISPLFHLLGFGMWQASVSLIFGIVAKEIIVGTFGALYSAGGHGLVQVLSEVFTPLSAFSFMVFTLLYTPCIPTLAAIRRETNSWRWALFSAIYMFIVAWIFSFVVYNGGLLLGVGS